MAIQNDPRLYSGGAVKLDSSPYVNLQIQLMAKKQAKDEALDEYYNNLSKSINPAGLRTQDSEGFMGKVSGMRQFFLQNKDKIKNPTIDQGKSQAEYFSRYQDAMNYVNNSKQEAEKSAKLAPLLIDPEKRKMMTDATFQRIHAHDLPLTDPTRKSFDLTELEFNPKEYSAKDWQEYHKNFGEGIKPDKTIVSSKPHPSDPLKEIEVAEVQYSPDKLKQLVTVAKNDYANDPSLRYSFDKSHPFKEWKAEHEEEFNRINASYKSVAGKDIQDDADLHAALVLDRKLQPEVQEKVVSNEKKKMDLQFERDKQMQAIRHANAKELIEFRESINPNDTEMLNTWIDTHLDNLEEAANNNNGVLYKFKNGSSTVEKDIPLDPVLAKALVKQGIEPSALRITRDGRYRPVYFERDEKGKLKGEGINKEVDTELSIPISRDQLKLALGYKATTGKQRTKEMLSKKGASKPSGGDAYSVQELKGAGWTDEQIKEAVKLGKIKIN